MISDYALVDWSLDVPHFAGYVGLEECIERSVIAHPHRGLLQ